MDLDQLLDSVRSRSVMRFSVDLVASSGDGLVCPPTYASSEGRKGPPHLEFRRAWVQGAQRDIVVLDSPQSQSNRIEMTLLQALRGRRFAYPDIEIAFPAEFGEPVYSVLQLSHRVYDAVMRACNWNGKPFFESDVGRAIEQSRPAQATALFTHAPVTLVLGAWDSNGGGGPLAAKLPRLLTSEIIGLDAQPASISATKFDPMDIRSNVAELIKTGDRVRRFTIKGEGAKVSIGKGKQPSALGFGSVPSTAQPRAAVVSGALQTSVLSCSGLRNLSFPGDDGKVDPQRDEAARAVLAALALYGLVAQNESGYLLRSRCELLPKDAGRLDLIGRTLEQVQTVALSPDTASDLLTKALAHASNHGLQWRLEPIRLEADDRLRTLVQRSRAAVASGDDDGEA
jgi:CRISPR-associated protein Csb1